MVLDELPKFPGTGMTSVEIFSGAGGLSLGVERAGFHHAALVEIDKHACATLRNNARQGTVGWSEATVFERDVVGFDYEQYFGKTNLLAGGAPCQPWSLAGRQQGVHDRRNLFPEIFRAVRSLQPQA